MGELRRDPVVNRWVIIDSERAERDALFQMELCAPIPASECPFCPGREAEDDEIFALGKPGRTANEPGWWLRVIPDRYPIVRSQGVADRRSEGIFDLMNAIGIQEVVIETPEHYTSWPELDDLQVERILLTYRTRNLNLRQDERLRQIVVVKNHGRAVSAFQHPHSLIIALPTVPKGVEEEIQGAAYHFHKAERCIYCDIIEQEVQMGKRVIQYSARFVALAPFASRFPCEVWVLPTQHAADYRTTSDEEIGELAVLLKAVLGRLEEVIQNFSCSIILHTAPLHQDVQAIYHWHLELLPKITKVAGFEWGTGFFINPIPPEEAASRLRGDWEG
jgi:UDPglucose--hexose-1-phosphate uridylyltransferase